MTSQSKSAVLVTGGAGFIGSHLVDTLSKSNDQIIVLDKMTYAAHPRNLEKALQSKNVELLEGDILDRDLVDKILKNWQIEKIYHLAAESHVDRSIDKPADFIQTNILGTYQILQSSFDYWMGLEELKKKKFRFIQVSTDEVFGALPLEEPELKFHEETKIQPRSPYSASKASGDLLALAWFHTYGFPVIVTNCSNNYGPRQFPEKLIPRMIQCALKNDSLPIYGDGRYVRDWIHVDDHCHGLILAAEKGQIGERYCFGGNAEVANIDLVHQICDLLDELHPRKDSQPRRNQIQFVKDRLGHDRRYAIDDHKAQKELGYTRQHKNFAEGLRKTVLWYLENQSWFQGVTVK